MRLSHFALLTALLLPTAVACGSADSDSDSEAVWRVENPELGIAIADMVQEFELVTNDSSALEFNRAAGEEPGTLWFEVGPNEDIGINLVEIISSQRAIFEEMPNGVFKGNNELMLANGKPAYYSRGQFDGSGERQEEFRITTLHPNRNAVMKMFYRYPESGAENSAERLNHLLFVLGELEGLENVQEIAEVEAIEEAE